MSLIVIVDDRSINRTIYTKLAQSIGPEIAVRAFGDPTEALSWLAGERADLIITDHDMPQIDGDEFITRFRALPDAARVPVMMITVRDQRMLRLRALESGANDFLHSPIDHCEFVMRARNLLTLARARDPRGGIAQAGIVSPTAARGEPEAGRAAPPAQNTSAPADWRFLPRLDLGSGRIVGAQVLFGGCPAELGDAQALRALLSSAAQLRARRQDPIRFTLAARFAEGEAPMALRLVGRLAESGLAPYWLNMRFEAWEILASPNRAEREAQAFDALGVGLTLDLGSLSQDARREKGWALAEPLEAFIEQWRPSIAFDCARGEDEAQRLALRLSGWRGQRPVTLLAEGVHSVAMLKPLRRAGVSEAQGACFGAPFTPRDLLGVFPALGADAVKRSA
jgi:CheY-like chemotaxis protein